MAGRCGGRGSGPTNRAGSDAASRSGSSLPLDRMKEPEAPVPVGDSGPEPVSLPNLAAVPEATDAGTETALAPELLETASPSALQLQPTEPAERMPATAEHKPYGDAEDAADQEPSIVQDSASTAPASSQRE